MGGLAGAVAVLTEPAVLVAGGVAVVVAGLGGWLTEIGPWYRDLRFPRWKPPNWLFGPAWTLIFVLVVASAVQAWWAADGAQRGWLVMLFGINAVLNIGWSLLFFRLRRPDWAALEVIALWASIAALVVVTGRISPAAAWCLLPYWAWVSFAAVLNREIVRINPAFG